MKKILASVVAVAAVTGFASVAHAGGGGTSITGATSANSVHTGSAARTCDFTVTDGSLQEATALVTNLVSDADGLISTKCNNIGSTLKVELDTHTAGTDDPGAVGQTPIREYSLSGGTGAYTIAGATVPFSSTTPPTATAVTTISDIANAYSSTFSTVTVKAKVSAPTGQNLASGSYTVKVKATVTP